MALQYDIWKRIIDKMTADTPADDALRAAVERVERALSRFEATRIADLDWPTKVSVEPADLLLILSALTAPPVTEEMVERGARAMRDEALLYRVSQIQGFVNHPRDDRRWIRDLTLPPSDQVIWDGGPSSDEMMEALEHIKAKHIARAALTAALGVKNG